VRSRTAERLLRTTVCAEYKVQRSGVPGGCERNVRGIVDGTAAAIAQTIVRLVTLRYERGRRSIRLERGHDAAHQHAGRRERGERQTGTGCPRTCAPRTRAWPARREPSILGALSITTHGERRRRARTSNTSTRCISYFCQTGANQQHPRGASECTRGVRERR
jgi:hypothetical protein